MANSDLLRFKRNIFIAKVLSVAVLGAAFYVDCSKANKAENERIKSVIEAQGIMPEECDSYLDDLIDYHTESYNHFMIRTLCIELATGLYLGRTLDQYYENNKDDYEKKCELKRIKKIKNKEGAL